MEEIKIPKRSTTWIKIKPTLPTIPGSHWIENEDIGLDRDVRLTRGPINLRRLDHDFFAMVENHTFEEVIIKINQPLGTLYKNPVLDSSDPQFHNLKKKYHQNDNETNSQTDSNSETEMNNIFTENENINVTETKPKEPEIPNIPEVEDLPPPNLKENVNKIFADLGIDQITGINYKIRRSLKRIVAARIKAFSSKNL